MVLFPAIYLLAALYFLRQWWKAFKQDTELSAEESRFSWFVLIIATLLWPVVVPISMLEKSFTPAAN